MRHIWTAIALAFIGVMAARAWLATPAPPVFEELAGLARTVDGDTIRVGDRRVRIGAIDACEIGQTGLIAGQRWDCGSAGRDAMARMIEGRAVSCRVFDIDQYDRLVAQCFAENRDIGLAMVTAGHAFVVTRWLPRAHPLDLDQYRLAESAARERNAGLWGAEIREPSEHRAGSS